MPQVRRSPRVCRTPQASSPSKGGDSHDFRLRLRTRGHTGGRRSRISKDTSTHSAPRDVLKQLDACFAFGPARSQANATLPRQRSFPEMDTKSEEAMLQLTNALTKTGKALYKSAVDDIAQAHGDIEQQIDRLSSACSTTLNIHDQLYDNISWPLGQTRCSDSMRPRATLSMHLGTMGQEIKTAKKKLADLEKEWKRCLQAETDAWEAMQNDDVSNAQQDRRGAQSAARVIKDSFKKEARAIATAKHRELEDVEAVYKQALQAETAKMMQNFMMA